MIELMNLRENKPQYPYDRIIDRRTALGNPFYMGTDEGRNLVCNEYQKWFYDHINSDMSNDHTMLMISELLKLRSLYKEYGKLRLFCWCYPKRCHGETIKEYLEEHM